MKKWLVILIMSLSTSVYADNTFQLGEVKTYEDMLKAYKSFVKEQPKDQQEQLSKSMNMLLMSSVLMGAEEQKDSSKMNEATIATFKKLVDGKTTAEINAIYKKVSDNTMLDSLYDLMQAQHTKNQAQIQEMEDKLLGNSPKLPE